MSFKLKNLNLRRYFESDAGKTIPGLDNTTAEWIANQMQMGFDEELSPLEIGARMSDLSEQWSRDRAENIAVTEAAKASTYVENQATKRYGITTHKWHTSLDEKVCPICIPLEGEEVAVGANFSAGVDGPPAHNVCRCFMDDVVPEGWTVPEDPWNGD